MRVKVTGWMEVNPPKCAQGKVTFRTSERRRYPERGPASLHSHWSVLNTRLHLLGPLYTWCTVRSADHACRFSLNAHTEKRLYARFETQRRWRHERATTRRQKRRTRIDSGNSTDNRVPARRAKENGRLQFQCVRSDRRVACVCRVQCDRCTNNFETGVDVGAWMPGFVLE